MTNRPKPLSESELAQAFASDAGRQYPAVLTPKQLAELLGMSVKTIYEWLEKGRLANSSRHRGKRVLIFRDRAINEIFSGKDWVKK